MVAKESGGIGNKVIADFREKSGWLIALAIEMLMQGSSMITLALEARALRKAGA